MIYRPHPRSGVVDAEYRAANETIKAAIARANAADPAAQHVFDDGKELGWQLAAADVAITDISAMIYDRLATGKPIIVTRPTSPHADVDENGYLGAAEWLTADAAGDILAILEQVQVDEDARHTLAHWAERHFGDTTPGAATRRFRAAIVKLLREWDRHAALHRGDALGSEGDPFVEDDDD